MVSLSSKTPPHAPRKTSHLPPPALPLVPPILPPPTLPPPTLPLPPLLLLPHPHRLLHNQQIPLQHLGPILDIPQLLQLPARALYLLLEAPALFLQRGGLGFEIGFLFGDGVGVGVQVGGAGGEGAGEVVRGGG